MRVFARDWPRSHGLSKYGQNRALWVADVDSGRCSTREVRTHQVVGGETGHAHDCSQKHGGQEFHALVPLNGLRSHRRWGRAVDLLQVLSYL